MKKIIPLIGAFLLCVTSKLAAEYCFLAKEQEIVLKSEGDCSTRYAPGSTFKIALSLIGFDAGILHDPDNPRWSYLEEYDSSINVCKRDNIPRFWMRDSCIWYSQVLTSKLGMETLQTYIEQFKYGNMDLSGDKGKNNGLTHAWLSSSLQISPEEQTEFLQKIIEQTLPVSRWSYDQTKKIIYIQELPGGWKLSGKTGNGRQLDLNGDKTDLQHGWFIGYIEKDQRSIVFASHLIDNQKENTFASFRARNEALIRLWYLIDKLEK